MRRGAIVEYDEELYIYFGIGKSSENQGSVCYDRECLLYKYDPELPDEIEIKKRECKVVEVFGVTKLPFFVRNDKIPYGLIGHTELRGVKKYIFERKYPTPPEYIAPTK